MVEGESSYSSEHEAVTNRGSGSRGRVAILIPTLAGGGAERTALFLASGLLDRGHDVDVLLRDLVCDYPTSVPAGVRLFSLSGSEQDGAPGGLERLPVAPRSLASTPSPISHRFPRLALAASVKRAQLSLLTSTSLPGWAVAIAGYLDREVPDAVLAMMSPAVAAAALAVRLAQTRTRVVARAENVFRSRRKIRRARRSYPYADAAVGVSLGVSSELGEICGVSHDRIHTIYNPAVPDDLPRKVREVPDHPWCKEPEPPLIVSIGRLHRQKDFPTLLIAFSRLVQHRPARLLVLGKGPLLHELLALARELGISGHVDFPGFVENPYAYLARARLFVLSSRHEGIGNVLIEAMACGCPVVSTDCPYGPDEILEGGRWGELVPVGDPVALAAAMVRAMESPHRREALRDRASFFSSKRAVSRYEELLLG